MRCGRLLPNDPISLPDKVRLRKPGLALAQVDYVFCCAFRAPGGAASDPCDPGPYPFDESGARCSGRTVEVVLREKK